MQSVEVYLWKAVLLNSYFQAAALNNVRLCMRFVDLYAISRTLRSAYSEYDILVNLSVSLG